MLLHTLGLLPARRTAKNEQQEDHSCECGLQAVQQALCPLEVRRMFLHASAEEPHSLHTLEPPTPKPRGPTGALSLLPISSSRRDLAYPSEESNPDLAS